MPNIFETTDAAGSTATTYALGIGQTASGTLAPVGDHDWYRVTLQAGQTYTFAVAGTGGPGAAVLDPTLLLRSADGTILLDGDDDGPGLNSSITFTAATSGTYYLDAGGLNETHVGGYGISATLGSRANYDELMGAGNLYRLDRSWSATPATGVNVTWSASTTNPNQTDASGNPSPFIQLTSAQIEAARTALALYSDVAGITFTQVNPGGTSDDSTMRFSAYNSTSDGAGAYAYYPGSTASGAVDGNVSLNTDSVSSTDLPLGSYSFFAMMHEIGHAVGMAHPGDYNAAPGVSITYENSAQFIQDSQQYTVMSYFDESATTTSFNSYADTLMLFDVLALQQAYGVNYTTRAGDTVYGYGSNAGSVFDFAINTDPALCIWDGGGTDTINASGFGQAQTINLTAGTFSNILGFNGNVSIAFGAVIENAIGGGGNDTLLGNAVANRLDGRGGADTMSGLGGNDVYVVDNAGDIVVEGAGGGSDGVYVNDVSYALGAAAQVELLATGNGSGSAAVNLTGNDFAQSIIGNNGANRIDGKGGIDTMNGRGGNDTYVVDNAGDVIVEGAGGGTDGVYVNRISYVLGAAAQVELLATGDGSGTTALNLTGNDFAQSIMGNNGVNRLDGKGGIDTMNGRGGNDTYVVDNAGDVIVEGAGGGTDGVYVNRTSYVLTAAAQVELLATGDGSGTTALNLVGNGFVQSVIGNDGTNRIDSKGGADTMMGRGGADTFVFSSALNQGIDKILDFNVSADTIELKKAIFGAAGNIGQLLLDSFWSSASGTAHDASDRILYSKDSGAVFYDADGNTSGGVAAVQFATLTANLSLTNADFIIA